MTTSIGTADSPASTTAGWKFAAAVPLVHNTTAGTPPRPIPRATNAATRSSCTTCTVMSPFDARATAMGVLREPGATTACRTPRRTHSSTRVAQNVAATDITPTIRDVR